MKRIVLFLATNLAVVVVLGAVAHLTGLDRALDAPGGALDLRALLLFAALFGCGGALISLAASKWMARRMTGAVVIDAPRTADEQWLVATVARLARHAGVGMPEVAVYPDASLNAFATGMRRDHALVAVSSGLLARMERPAVEAVLAHEVSHVANGDMVTLALIQGVVNTFVIFFARIVGHFVDHVVLRNEEGHGPGYWVATIVAEIAFGILASLIVLWFSRQREYRADAGAAAAVGPAPMIAALECLRRERDGAGLPARLRAFGIRGASAARLGALFLSHPPLEARIAALRAAG